MKYIGLNILITHNHYYLLYLLVLSTSSVTLILSLKSKIASIVTDGATTDFLLLMFRNDQNLIQYIINKKSLQITNVLDNNQDITKNKILFGTDLVIVSI